MSSSVLNVCVSTHNSHQNTRLSENQTRTRVYVLLRGSEYGQQALEANAVSIYNKVSVHVSTLGKSLNSLPAPSSVSRMGSYTHINFDFILE